MKRFQSFLAAACLGIFLAAPAPAAEKIKIGFLVKQAEEPWFQTEWDFADKAGADLGLEVMKIAIPDGEKTLNAIDTLAASGAKGFVICVPDTKLGPAVKRKADSYGLKLIAVDDQFVNAKGEPMTDVPLVMMAAAEIGALQGDELWKEMQKRGWKTEETAVMAITAEELETARLRTNGSIEALIRNGFPENRIYKVATKTNDIPGALDAGSALLARYPEVKNWLVVGMNDNTVLGGVRATEGQRIPPANVIAIGINGVDAVNELAKPNATGFLGSLLPSPDVHGYKTVSMLHDWIVNGKEPPAFTAITDTVLITRENYKEELKKKGL
jgi:L-arabinose transport system substrate-binding protein